MLELDYQVPINQVLSEMEKLDMLPEPDVEFSLEELLELNLIQ